MNSSDIKDVLALQNILTYTKNVPELIASLIEWRDGTLGTVEPVAPQPEPTPEPELVAAPVAPPAKAPAKASKGRAKPPPANEPDDSVTGSDDDADF